MKTFLCPRCGESVQEDHPDFPRCIFCGENLLRCGFCRHFPGEGQLCRRAKGQPVVYTATVLDCAYYTPRFLVRRTHSIFSPSGKWQVAASLMFTVSVLIVAFLSRPTPSRLLLSVTAPKQVVIGNLVGVRLLVKANPREVVRLRLDRHLLNNFQLIGITPLPSRVDSQEGFYEFVLPVTEDPQPITLKLKGVKVGEYAIRAVVMTTPKQVARWQERIRVVTSPKPKRPPKRLSLLAMWMAGEITYAP